MIELKSFAKINLGLEITGKRPDGYHTLKTIFQTITLHDIIEIKVNPKGTVNLTGYNADIPWDTDNSIHKAVTLMNRTHRLNKGFDITVKKNIPPGAGLGGGSSNAAVMLLFLNRYFNLGLDDHELMSYGAKIGADVPFFIVGGTAIGEGIGERITPIHQLDEQTIGLIIPNINVSTHHVFSLLNLTNQRIESKINTFLKTKDFSILENNLENVTFSIFPEIRKIKEKIMASGYDNVQMSGSGAAVYTILEKDQIAKFRKLFPDAMITRTINNNHYHQKIGAWPSGKASAFGAEMRRFESSRPRGEK